MSAPETKLPEHDEFISKPPADYPQYWLAQIALVADQEARNILTKAEMVKEVQRIMKEMHKHSARQRWQAERILRREPA